VNKNSSGLVIPVVLKAEAERRIVQITNDLTAQFEAAMQVDRALGALDAWMCRIADVASVTCGNPAALRVYLSANARQPRKDQLLNSRLYGAMRLIQDYLPGELCAPEVRKLVEIVQAIETAIDAVIDGRDNGDALRKIIEDYGSENARTLLATLRNEINLGGRPLRAVDPVLDAIWHEGIALFREYGRKWATITRLMTQTIFNKADTDRNPKEQIIYHAWQQKSYPQRKEQIRQAFRGYTISPEI
jgi:hypothetical protein